MSYEIYRYIFIVAAALSAVMAVISVIVFFYLRIPTVLGDLTGLRAKKAIQNIRAQNESGGNKVYSPSKVNLERGKLTDKISPSGRIVKAPSSSLHGAGGTEKITTQRLSKEQFDVDQTTVLDEQTTVLEAETTVLGGAVWRAQETTVLTQATECDDFVIEYEITFIHSNEMI